MADHHSETVLNLLNSWRIILNKEAEALSQGNIQELESLFDETSKIQEQLGHLFSSSKFVAKNRAIPSAIKELLQKQDEIIDSLKTQTAVLGQEIAVLSKSKTSLKGYKQNTSAPPSYMNKRT